MPEYQQLSEPTRLPADWSHFTGEVESIVSKKNMRIRTVKTFQFVMVGTVLIVVSILFWMLFNQKKNLTREIGDEKLQRQAEVKYATLAIDSAKKEAYKNVTELSSNLEIVRHTSADLIASLDKTYAEKLKVLNKEVEDKLSDNEYRLYRRLDSLQGALTGLRSEIGNFKGDLNLYKTQQNNLQSSIADMKISLGSLDQKTQNLGQLNKSYSQLSNNYALLVENYNALNYNFNTFREQTQISLRNKADKKELDQLKYQHNSLYLRIDSISRDNRANKMNNKKGG